MLGELKTKNSNSAEAKIVTSVLCYSFLYSSMIIVVVLRKSHFYPTGVEITMAASDERLHKRWIKEVAQDDCLGRVEWNGVL